MRAGLVAAALALFPLAGAAHADPVGETGLAKMLEGRVAGAPLSCVPARLTQATVIDKTAIVYRVGSTLYVNRPNSGADQLDSDDIMVTRQFSSQLCNVDKIDQLDRGTRNWRGFVLLGDFVPYTKPTKR